MRKVRIACSRSAPDLSFPDRWLIPETPTFVMIGTIATVAGGLSVIALGRGGRKGTTGIPTGDDASTVSDTEADEREEHLRGLGYLE